MSDRMEVSQLSAKLGSQFLLAQGAGGNISWKEGDTLWVKASGTWLKDALTEDIFVPIDLPQIRQQIEENQFKEVPSASNGESKRPSIETWFHALISYKYVLHLHALEVLALLVQEDAENQLRELLPLKPEFQFVPYSKPGEKLASEIAKTLRRSPATKALFLQNHGIVVGSDDLTELEELLNQVVNEFGLEPKPIEALKPRVVSKFIPPSGYELIQAHEVNQLASSENFWNIIPGAWAITPDHVVFLGDRPLMLEPEDFNEGFLTRMEAKPKLVFVRGEGIFTTANPSAAILDQIRAYFEILVRLDSDAKLRTFTVNEISELLNWDAERYRQAISK